MSSMSPSSRDGSRDRSESRMVKHQHSFSETGRSSVPMWDSSDPDRAPPPLPLNPGAIGSPLTRSNTSARIEEAAALITARARDSAPSSYTSNPSPSPSPDKGMMKPHHRRMQTIQNSTVGRLSDSLERRSPEKGLRTSKLSEFEDYRSNRASDRSPNRLGSDTPTPASKRSFQEENTPPSSNMLALQTVRHRQESQPPLGDISNGVSPTMQSSYSFDALSSQILNITTIATSLQREMANLSKRSKDNASDLIGLKDATNARDEDIRKSLRELLSGLDHRFSSLDSRLLTGPETSRSVPNLGGLYLDDKAHNTTPNRKTFTLPRIPSPSSFDRDITASPSLACVDGAASIALLEKVLREMGTRDGQDKILQTLEGVRSKVHSNSKSADVPQTKIDPIMMSKLEDILVFLKDMRDDSASRALVRAGDHNRNLPSADLYLEGESRSGPLAKIREGDRRASNMSAMGSDIVNEEVVKMLKSVKQSLSQGGGLTNEVKALVRELRGEVLGMGRDIARRLEQTAAISRSANPELQAPGRHEISMIVEQALAELKEHMHHVVKESRRQPLESTRSVADTQEVVHAVRTALAEMPRPREVPVKDPVAEREELLAAVKSAWEDCKPEIALEHFGLERDEILDTLKEGLKSYQPNQATAREAGVSYDEVLEAVRRGLAEFQPPKIETEAGVTREELLTTVRECLESHEWPQAPAMGSDISSSSLSRRDMVEAVKEGLTFQAPIAKEVEFNREDLFDAIRSCLEGEQNPLGGMGERVVEAMHEFLGSMKTEFQQYSAANGKDTEQVLDALKDGLEDLRTDIESYVDRASDVTGKDEIIDTVKAGFAAMQDDLDKGFAARSAHSSANTPELLDAMEREFQHLRETISKSMARSEVSSDREEIIDAIRDMTDGRQSSLSSNSEDVVRLVKEELEHMRLALAGTLVKSGSSVQRDEVLDVIREGLESHRSAPRMEGTESALSNTSELLDAFQEGVDGIRTDLKKLVDRPVDVSSSYEILDTLKVGIEDVRADIQRLQEGHRDGSEPSNPRDRAVVVHDENMISTEIEGLKVMITQLRIKVEALDNMPATAVPMASETRIHKDDLDEIHTAIAGIHASVNQARNAPVPEVVMPTDAASKDDIDAIETLIRNLKAQVDEIADGGSESTAKTAHLDVLEDMLRDIKLAVEDSAGRSSDSSGKIDLELTELLIRDVQKSVEDIQTKLRGVGSGDGILSKNEIHVVESLCLDIKSQIEALPLPDLESLPNKEDIVDVRESIKAFREQIEADNELTAQAFEARKIEHGGLATKIDDVRNIIGDLREEVMSKLDGSEEGIVELNKVLGMHHDNMSTYATATNMAELSALVKREFDRHLDHLTGSKADMEVRDATLFGKHEETSAELKGAIEDKFNELMIKYDDAQQSNNTKLHALHQRDSAHLDAATSTKAVVDDLKILMDTLGSTVTETCDRMSDDAKTVFVRVDEANNKIGELHTANALEHGHTREEIEKTLAGVSRLEGTMAENQPAMMAAIREVLEIVGQHFEHSQQQTESFTRATEEIKTGVSSIPASIPPLLPALPDASASPSLVREIPAQKEYDDTQVHDKLNNLISHAAVAKEVFANIEHHHKTTQESLASMEKLDIIHKQVLGAASEISAMVATQSRLMADQHESKAVEATEAAIALEKRTAQKERVEADIVAMNEEKNALIASMAALRREHEELSGQTKRLSREVGKLETALDIRHAEMREMNNKAETLERRILEGLMNHARSVKGAKPRSTKKISPAERDASMNLKRVPSSASTVLTRTSVKDGSIMGNAVGVALKKRTPLGSTGNSAASRGSVDRRILSTSHVTGNRGREAPERALVLAPVPKTGLVSLKRSHSVKSNPSSVTNGRKPSWNAIVSSLADKENRSHDENDSGDENSSDTGTERRTSISGTSYMYTDSLTYGTGSSLSGSSGRTVSYASSIGGTINGQTESIAEEDEEHEFASGPNQAIALLEPAPSTVEAGQDNSMALTTFVGPETETAAAGGEEEHDDDDFSDLRPPPLITGDGLKYHEASDSGLGTEPPTADYERIGEALEYFNMTAQDLQT